MCVREKAAGKPNSEGILPLDTSHAFAKLTHGDTDTTEVAAAMVKVTVASEVLIYDQAA